MSLGIDPVIVPTYSLEFFRANDNWYEFLLDLASKFNYVLKTMNEQQKASVVEEDSSQFLERNYSLDTLDDARRELMQKAYRMMKSNRNSANTLKVVYELIRKEEDHLRELKKKQNDDQESIKELESSQEDVIERLKKGD